MKPRDLAELVLLGAIWGASFLFMRIAAPVFGPIPLIEVRVSLAAIMLIAVMAAQGRLAELKKNRARLLFVGMFNSAIPFSLFAYATLSLPAGYASVLNATSPLFGAIVAAVWLHEPMPWRKILALVVGFLGVLILVSEKLSAAAELKAVAAGLAAALSYGITACYTKRRLSHVAPMTVASGSLMWAAVALLPFAFLKWPEQPPTMTAWMCSVALAFLCTGAAYIFYFRSLAKLGPVRASTVAYLIPVFGTIWGSVFLDEVVTPRMLIGAAVILCGVAMMSLVKK